LGFASFASHANFVRGLRTKNVRTKQNNVFLVISKSVQVRNLLSPHLHTNNIKGINVVGFLKKRSTQPTRNNRILIE